MNRLRVGRTIRISQSDYEEHKRNLKYEKWKIVKIYPYIVTCKNSKGFIRSFTIGDLIINGIIEQSPEFEAMRKARENDINGRRYEYNRHT